MVACVVVGWTQTGGVDCLLVLLLDAFAFDKALVFLELLFYL